MSLLTVILILLVVALGLYIVNNSPKVPTPIAVVLNSIVAIAVVIWLLKILGFWEMLANIKI